MKIQYTLFALFLSISLASSSQTLTRIDYYSFGKKMQASQQYNSYIKNVTYKWMDAVLGKRNLKEYAFSQFLLFGTDKAIADSFFLVAFFETKLDSIKFRSMLTFICDSMPLAIKIDTYLRTKYSEQINAERIARGKILVTGYINENRRPIQKENQARIAIIKGNRIIAKLPSNFTDTLNPARICANIKVSPDGKGEFISLAKGSTSNNERYPLAIKQYLTTIEFNKASTESDLTIRFSFGLK